MTPRTCAPFAVLLPLIAAPAFAATGPPAAVALVERMTDAHGGLAAWTAAPTVSWVDQWTTAGEPPEPPMRVVVEQGRRRAHLETLDGAVRAAWDGEQAWGLGRQGPPPRFMALLNFYFLNLPWVVHDPGVVLGEPQRARLWDEPTEYWTVRMTFEAGVGDTPRDYYLLYLDPDSHRLRAVEYVVTYRALVPEGAESTPPHVLVFEEWTTADGLVVPTAFTIYGLDRTELTACAIRDWSFRASFDASRLAKPEGAVVDTSTP